MHTYTSTAPVETYIQRIFDLGDSHGISQYPFINMVLSLTNDLSQAKVARFFINPADIPVNPGTALTEFAGWVDRMANYFQWAFRALFDNWDMNDTTWLPTFTFDQAGGGFLTIESESFIGFDLRWSPFLINYGADVFDPDYGPNIADGIGLPNIHFPGFGVRPAAASSSIKVAGVYEGDVRIKLVDHNHVIDTETIAGNPTADYDSDLNVLRVCLHTDPPVALFTASILASQCGGPT